MPNEATGSIMDAKAIKELLQPIIDSVNTISDGQKGLALEIQGIKEGTKKDILPTKTETSERDLESMSRKEFMAQIMAGVGTMLDEKVKPVSQKLEEKTEKELEETVNKAVKEAQTKHTDFWEWKKEIGDELVKNPYLMPEDAYQLARIHNAEKAKEMDIKFPSEEETKKTEEKKAAGESLGFGGLTPTSGKTVPSEKMKFEEAAEAAWQETAGHLEKK